MINSLLLNKESQLTVLRVFKKYKALWKKAKYKRLKENIKRCYQAIMIPYMESNSKDLRNIVEISMRDNSIQILDWENNELFAWRLMKYDFLVSRILTLWPCQDTGTTFWKYSTTKTSNYINQIYLVELLQDASLCQINNSKKPPKCYFNFMASSQVRINGDNYYHYLENAYVNNRIIREDLYWNNKMISNITEKIMSGVDFNLEGCAIEDNQEEKSENIGEEKKLEFPPKEWEDFHFSFDEKFEQKALLK